MHLLVAGTSALSPALLTALRALWDEAFDHFDDHDAEHGMGGVHVIALEGTEPVAHASVVPRRILVGHRPFATGYVENVATRPDLQGRGLGARVMAELGVHLRARYEFGMLATGSWGFYERLGWERWRGPSWVLTDAGRVRSAEEDDGLMALRFGPSADVDLTAHVTCEDRPGDAW